MSRGAMSRLILPSSSVIHREFRQLIRDADIVFFAGLPGVGKSLLLQQLSLMALAAGRSPTLLQWDVARQPFETPRYPLVDGATHPLVIRATGAWLRGSLVAWHERALQSTDMLLGEVPLIGGRFMEIARAAADDAESLLRDQRTAFLIPLPSRRVRALIESSRARSIAEPTHANEAHDAPPELLRALWHEVLEVAAQLGIAPAVEASAPYSPQVYADVYRHLLQHRNAQTLPVNEMLEPSASAYADMERLPTLQATAAQAEAIMAGLEASVTAEAAFAAAATWYLV